jgi:hypothetical protein
MNDNAGTQENMRVDPDTCRDPDLLAAEVRRLRAVIAAGDCPEPDNAAKPDRLADAEREAVERACRFIASTMPYESQHGAEDYQTLRGLLERLK